MISISVIVPFFDAERYLGDCLDSVRAQGVPDLELVCVDDGSTDGSRRIVEAAADLRVTTCVHPANLGVGAARNTGLQRATGDYVFFLDADDRLQPGSVAAALEIATRDRLDVLQVDYVDLVEDAAGAAWLAAHNRQPKTTASAADSAVMDGPGFLVHVIEGHLYRPTVWSYLLRRGHLETHGLRFAGIRCHEDAEFVPRCLLPARRVRAAGLVTHVHRRRHGSLMTTDSPQHRLDSLAACGGIAASFTGRDVDPRIRDRFSSIVGNRIREVLRWLDTDPAAGAWRERVLETIDREGLRGYLPDGGRASGAAAGDR